MPDDEVGTNAEVEAGDDNLQVSSFTDIDGKYKLIGVPSGTYSISCELEGYIGDTINNITVTSGQSTSLNFKLEKD